MAPDPAAPRSFATTRRRLPGPNRPAALGDTADEPRHEREQIYRGLHGQRSHPRAPGSTTQLAGDHRHGFPGQYSEEFNQRLVQLVAEMGMTPAQVTCSRAVRRRRCPTGTGRPRSIAPSATEWPVPNPNGSRPRTLNCDPAISTWSSKVSLKTSRPHPGASSGCHAHVLPRCPYNQQTIQETPAPGRWLRESHPRDPMLVVVDTSR